MTLAIFIFLAGLFYALSFAYAALSKTQDSARRAVPCVWIGWIFQACALSLRLSQSGTIFGTSYDFLETFVFAFVSALLLCNTFFKLRFLEFFSMLPIAILTLLPLFCPVFVSSMESGEISHPNSSQFGLMHGILSAFSFASLGIASLFALMYLLQKKLLQKKSNSSMGKILPSLSILQKLLRAWLKSAFAFMCVSLIFGVMAVVEVNAAYVLKFSTGLVIFGLEGAMCYVARAEAFAGSKKAFLTLFGTALCVLLLIPIYLKDLLL